MLLFHRRILFEYLLENIIILGNNRENNYWWVSDRKFFLWIYFEEKSKKCLEFFMVEI